MPVPVCTECRHNSRFFCSFSAIYIAIISLSFHWGMVAYINSSLLERFMSPAAVGTLFTIGAALTILIFLFISRVLKRAGNFKLTIALSLINLGAVGLMGNAETLRVVIPAFLVHFTVLPLMLFNLDIFMERLIGNKEQATGGRRGLFLALMSLAGALSPLFAGYLMGSGPEPNFTLVYTIAALSLIPFLVIIIYAFSRFKDAKYHEVKVLPTLQTFWVKQDVRNVFLAHLLLQLFFAFMVIYSPLYIVSELGMSWQDFGLVLLVGLSAYVFLEYPIGIIADKYIGEKEMMALGFLILSVSVSWFAFIDTPHLYSWMLVMFMTRVGASFVEVTTESYFFKHANGSDTNIISFFRITRPLSYVIGALLGSIALLYLPFNLLFVLVGFAMATGLFFTTALKDTK